MLVARWFRTSPLDDAVAFLCLRPHVGELVDCFVPSNRMRSDVLYADIVSPLNCSILYAIRSRTASSLFALPLLLLGTVRPVAVLIACMLSAMKVTRRCPPNSPYIYCSYERC